MIAAQGLRRELDELRLEFESWSNCDAVQPLGKAMGTLAATAREPKAVGL